MPVLHLVINEKLYLKDPETTDLGKRIIQESIRMIDEMGFESFTFRKLSARIDSAEASIYRYFENKHRLLMYLITWYWAWTEYRIDYTTNHLSDAREQLDMAIRIITEKKEVDPGFGSVDEQALQRIVMAESEKVYLTKQVDMDNKEGFFRGYKSLCHRIAQLVLAINPDYRYAHSLISTALEAAHQQVYFAQHLPSLTEVGGEGDPYTENYQFLKNLIFSAINRSL